MYNVCRRAAGLINIARMFGIRSGYVKYLIKGVPIRIHVAPVLYACKTITVNDYSAQNNRSMFRISNDYILLRKSHQQYSQKKNNEIVVGKMCPQIFLTHNYQSF